MIRGGDEFASTQRGNNNAYCQDNEISWLDWQHGPQQEQLRQFAAGLIRMKLEQPVFHRPTYFQGRPLRGSGVKDIYWRDPSGGEMTDEAWDTPLVRCLGVHLAGDAITDVDEHGERISGDSMFMLLNQSADAIGFTLPEQAEDMILELAFDTAEPPPEKTRYRGCNVYQLRPRSMVVFKIVKREPDETPAAG